MKILQIARKTLLESWRQPQLLLVFLLFPAAMILMYYYAFGQSGVSMARYLTVLVINHDEGGRGVELVEELRRAEFDGSPVFTLGFPASAEGAHNALAERKASLLLTIPANFTRSLESGTPVEVEVQADLTSDTAVFAGSFLQPLLDAYASRFTGWKGGEALDYEFLPGTGTVNDFQYGVPGLMVFGIMFGIITVAMTLTREAVSGTLTRMRLAEASGLDVVGGVTLAGLGAALIQAAVAFGTAAVFGFRSPGSLLLAGGICAVTSLLATAFGIITACFARSDGEATNLGTLLMVPLVFFSNTVFPIPPSSLFRLGGRSFAWYDFFPTTHAAEALRRVLIYGDGVQPIQFELAALTAATLLVLALSAALFQALRLKHS